jgi:hypothetical protein
MFLGDATNRNKYTVVLAENIQVCARIRQHTAGSLGCKSCVSICTFVLVSSTSVQILTQLLQPRLPAHQYLDGSDFEMEIRQFVGTIILAYWYKITNTDTRGAQAIFMCVKTLEICW